jgi:hypothetical protein
MRHACWLEAKHTSHSSPPKRRFDKQEASSINRPVNFSPRAFRSFLPLALLLFAMCLWLDTRNNTFPFFYHRDEPDKVTQLLENEWNFHHPTLMLVTAKLAAQLFRTPPEPQRVVETGRWVSAVFAALGVTALALLAASLRGLAGFLGVSVMLALHHQVFELAHYMKEDTALFMGLALTFLALRFFEMRRTDFDAILLGAACGLSLSAKYLGIVATIPALIALIFLLKKSAADNRSKSLLLFFAGLLGVTAAANYPLLANLQNFTSSFGREIALVTEGKGDVTRQVPHSEYLRAFIDNTNFAIWLLLAAFLVRFWKTRRERTFTEWSAVIFPFALALAMSFSPKANDRYFLPCTALFGSMAGLGVVDAAEFLRDRACLPMRASVAMILVVTAMIQILHVPKIIPNSLAEYYRAFREDDRKELAQWISKNLPADAVIAQDTYVGLPTPDRPERLKVQPLLAQKILSGKRPLVELTDSENPDSLRAQGVTYVVTSESDYGRYRRATLEPKDDKQAEFLRKKKFYDNLRANYPLLWSRSRSAVIYLHPGLELYDLAPAKQKG